MARRKIIAGNWKMHKTANETSTFINELKSELKVTENIEVVLCPTFTSLPAAAVAVAGSSIKIGGQNVHWAQNGAFTGEISTEMLKEIPVEYVIIGHSERRQFFGETEITVNQRLHAALQARLIPIVCVGESQQEREANQTEQVVERQLAGGLAQLGDSEMAPVVIAYEPVWAIGTGLTATPGQAQEVHAFIRRFIADQFSPETAAAIRILYGGSVKPGNAPELMSQTDIDGALVGGASLQVSEFAGIVAAC